MAAAALGVLALTRLVGERGGRPAGAGEDQLGRARRSGRPQRAALGRPRPRGRGGPPAGARAGPGGRARGGGGQARGRPERPRGPERAEPRGARGRRPAGGGAGPAAPGRRRRRHAAKLSLGSATVEELDGVDGIGPTLASASWSTAASGGFGSLGELSEVDGIGEARLPGVARGASALTPVVIAHRPWHAAMAAVALGLALAGSPRYAVAVAAAAVAARLARGARAPRARVRSPPRCWCSGRPRPATAAGRPRRAGRADPGRRPVTLRAGSLTPPRPGRFGSSAEAAVGAGRCAGTRLLVRAPAWARSRRGLGAGEELALAGRLGALAAPGRDDFDDYLRRRGVAGELRSSRRAPPAAGAAALPGGSTACGAAPSGRWGRGCPAADAALLRGMVLGAGRGIDPVTREDFRASGLAHLLAVSGQNVMLLVALALPLLLLGRRGARAHGCSALAALIAIYVPLAGAGPSLQRAGVMGLAGLAAMGASRPASRWYALLLAAVARWRGTPGAPAIRAGSCPSRRSSGILVLGVPLGGRWPRAWTELLPRRAGHGARRATAPGRVARSPTGWPSPWRPRWPRPRSSPTTSARFRSPACRRTCWRCRRSRRSMWLGMVKAALGQAGAGPRRAPEALGSPAAAGGAGYLAWLAGALRRPAGGGQLSLSLRSPAQVLARLRGDAAGRLRAAPVRPARCRAATTRRPRAGGGCRGHGAPRPRWRCAALVAAACRGGARPAAAPGSRSPSASSTWARATPR